MRQRTAAITVLVALAITVGPAVGQETVELGALEGRIQALERQLAGLLSFFGDARNPTFETLTLAKDGLATRMVLGASGLSVETLSDGIMIARVAAEMVVPTAGLEAGYGSMQLRMVTVGEAMEQGLTILPTDVILTRGEYDALRLTAYLSGEQFLTTKLKTVTVRVYHVGGTWAIGGLAVEVNTATQPSWNVYLGRGRFSVSDRELRAAYTEAGAAFAEMVRAEIDTTTDAYILVVHFAIRGSSVGRWNGWGDGVLTLEGEEADQVN